TMSLPRRERLLSFAHRHRSVIIEDNPYGMLRFAGESLPALSDLSPNDPLIFGVRTFSKFVAPGLRLGWIDVDPQVRHLAVNAKQTMDTCAPVPSQHLVAQWLSEGGAESHVEVLREAYRERKLTMSAGLERHFPGAPRATDPDGGFFLWVTVADESLLTEPRLPTSPQVGVASIPSPAFSPGGSSTGALRLCFASITLDRTDEGVERLRRAIDRQRACGTFPPGEGADRLIACP